MLRFEWDPAKEATNRRKHGIDFETARSVFDDPFHVSFMDAAVEGEERWHSVGSIEGVILILVVHTYLQKGSDEVIRIISARAATSHERKLYAEALDR